MRTTTIVLMSILFFATASHADEAMIDFKIDAPKLSRALIQLTEQSGLQLIYPAGDKVTDLPAKPLEGQYTTEGALKKLLKDSGLDYEFIDAKTISIVDPNAKHSANTGDGKMTKAKGNQGALMLAQNTGNTGAANTGTEGASNRGTAGPQEENSGSDSDKSQSDKLQEVIVTGTHLRGVYPASSPLEIYTAQDIERSGATTMEQFIQKLPQNMGTRTQYATGSIGAGDKLNLDAVAGVDLRGLGVGTSLVLMNGRRLGLSDFGRTADISLIPTSAIERVEVLTDGASAVYGSDAVGGVVNFVLRHDFDGAETRLAYGGVTRGGMSQGDFTQTFGRAWGSGHGLISYNFFSADALDIADRDYAAAAERGMLTPQEKRHNLLVTFSQHLGERLSVSGDFALARRDIKSDSSEVSSADPLEHSLTRARTNTDQSFVNLGLDYRLTNALNATLATTWSEAQVDAAWATEFYNLIPPTPEAPLSQNKKNSVRDVTATLDGALCALPGGEVRFSLGAGLLQEEFSGVNTTTLPIPGTLARDTRYAFGEFFLPLIGTERGIPWVRRLELNLAGRYTSYEDASHPALHREFGDGTDPKIGLLWAPFDALKLRATYGTSFRAPSLIQLDETSGGNFLINTRPIPLPNGPVGTRIQVAFTSAPDLGPETAETHTIGFDFHPAGRPGFQLSGTYYDISYSDRLAEAPRGGIAFLQTPELYPDAIYRPPSAAYIEQILRTTTNQLNLTGIDLSDPHAAALALFAAPNVWIADLRLKNLALSEQHGFDLSVSDRFDTAWGQIRLGANATRILSYNQQASVGSPVVSAINQVTLPVDLRGSVHVGLSRGGFDGTLSINYVDGYDNPLAITGPGRIESWTTADLNLSYGFGGAAGFLKGLRLNLSAQNLLDRDPPFIERDPTFQAVAQPVGFDPANANPLGRLVVLGLAKRW